MDREDGVEGRAAGVNRERTAAHGRVTVPYVRRRGAARLGGFAIGGGVGRIADEGPEADKATVGAVVIDGGGNRASVPPDEDGLSDGPHRRSRRPTTAVVGVLGPKVRVCPDACGGMEVQFQSRTTAGSIADQVLEGSQAHFLATD